ncbi:CDP-diacylglycerol--serine O-phosphatidyltransferase [Rhizobium sp. Root274]|uniref:CDP-diacylglycerol--serine O-phosphatidyltransferase n=1 Tax=unclassified Rhizobium TaxID=2613769 RepID=UPI0007139782|nr:MULTISPECIES: CDP-diacylglycerol--serine O-phosphatidyltransferase [unclassified Rhizobium]KQW31035.1 CDP-diacylglycerol--serine O-phosphatidyltransferase [Rhizobium sp. Root1240]KRD32583.1 CDP-diacylglycerol--serine O-phosphatidyltransferase [Rhizobium sp. Root274]
MDAPNSTPENGHPPASDPNARGPRLREIPLRLLIPNLITVLAICAGLTGIRLAFENRYELAVAMVLLAAFLDGIDGRVARMMKATSKFGAQMDSLADIINFGVAPALVLYVYVLDQARSLGWIAALIYTIAAGLRLARFNVMAERENKAPWQSEFFVGVPAPAGAALVLLPVYIGFLDVQMTSTFAYFSTAYTIVIAYLLVSRLPVWSGKSETSHIRRDLVFPMILGVVLYVALLMSFTWQVLVVTVVLYLGSLPLGARNWHKRYGTLTIGEETAEKGLSEIDRGV